LKLELVKPEMKRTLFLPPLVSLLLSNAELRGGTWKKGVKMGGGCVIGFFFPVFCFLSCGFFGEDGVDIDSKETSELAKYSLRASDVEGSVRSSDEICSKSSLLFA
jgi:hypothetical protein